MLTSVVCGDTSDSNIGNAAAQNAIKDLGEELSHHFGVHDLTKQHCVAPLVAPPICAKDSVLCAIDQAERFPIAGSAVRLIGPGRLSRNILATDPRKHTNCQPLWMVY